MTLFTEVDAKWWRTASGIKWHRMRHVANGAAPTRTVCGISFTKLVDFWATATPPISTCLICWEDE